MVKLRELGAHDALPDGHSVVVMRRMDEDAPARTRIELIVTNPDRSGEVLRAVHADGGEMSMEEALALGVSRAREEGLEQVWSVDRTRGRREQEVLRHHGDHSFAGEKLDDFDLEEGERGTDMRDRENVGALRKF